MVRAEHCDIVIDFGAWPRLESLLTALSGARCTVGMRTPGPAPALGLRRGGRPRHRPRDRQLPAARSPARASSRRAGPDCTSPPDATRPLAAAYVVLHLWPGGANFEERSWPLDRWRTVAEALERARLRRRADAAGPVTPGRTTRWSRDWRAAGMRVESVAGTTPGARRSSGSRSRPGSISVNTGVMHLAAAVGTPVVSLNGPTPVRRWGSIGSPSRSVASPLVPDGYTEPRLRAGRPVPRRDVRHRRGHRRRGLGRPHGRGRTPGRRPRQSIDRSAPARAIGADGERLRPSPACRGCWPTTRASSRSRPAASEVVAVSEAARPLFAAGLHRLTGARPLLLAVPTAAEAERIAGDLVPMLGADAGRAVPGVGDAAVRARLARRSRRWAAGSGSCGGSARAASARPRSSSPRCARSCSGSDRTSRTSSRSSSARATQVDRDELLEQLVGAGYRREYQVEARGEIAVARLDRRHLPVDRGPPGARRPVGRRDRPAVDVLGRGPAQQRGARRGRSSSRAASCSRPPRSERAPPSCCRRRRGVARSGSAWPRATCSTAWSRGCRGSPRTSTCCRTCSRAAPASCSSSRAGCATGPRSCSTRRRASPTRSSVTWGAEGHDFPRLSLPFDRLLAHTKAGRDQPARRRPTRPTPRSSRRPRSTRSSATSRRSRRASGRCATAGCASSSRPRARARRRACRTSSPAKA